MALDISNFSKPQEDPSELPSSVVSGGSTGGAVPWATGLVIPANEIVSNAGATYLCKSAHTAGASFDATQFDALNPLWLPSMPLPQRVQEGVITRFQSGHGWVKNSGTATVTDDTTELGAFGSQALKVVTAGDSAASQITHASLSPVVDLSASNLKIWLKVSDFSLVSSSGGLQLFLSSDNQATNNVSFTIHSTVSATPGVNPYQAKNNEWFAVELVPDYKENAVGAINLAAINQIRFVVKDNGAPLTVWFGGLSKIAKPAVGVVTFCFDDGYESIYDLARPKLDSYGFPATWYIIRDLITQRAGTVADTYTGLPNLLQCQNVSGWEIAAHADTVANHNAGFDSLADATVQSEMLSIKQWLLTHGLHGGDQFAWPKGQFTASQMALARQFFSGVRGTWPNTGVTGAQQETYPPGEPQRLRTWLVPAGQSTASVTSLVTLAATAKAWLILTFHNLVNPTSVATDYLPASFNTIVDAVASSGMKVKTMGEVFRSGVS